MGELYGRMWTPLEPTFKVRVVDSTGGQCIVGTILCMVPEKRGERLPYQKFRSSRFSAILAVLSVSLDDVPPSHPKKKKPRTKSTLGKMSCGVGDRTLPQELITVSITDYRAQVLGYQTDVLRTGRQARAAWRVGAFIG